MKREMMKVRRHGKGMKHAGLENHRRIKRLLGLLKEASEKNG